MIDICGTPGDCGPDESCSPVGVYGVCRSSIEPM